jgi:hypothetical protein
MSDEKSAISTAITDVITPFVGTSMKIATLREQCAEVHAMRKRINKTLPEVNAEIKAKVEACYKNGCTWRGESPDIFHNRYGYVAPGGFGRREWLFRLFDWFFDVDNLDPTDLIEQGWK